MRFLFAALFTIIAAQPAFASWGACTKWERRQGYSCVFNGRSSPEWVRQCTHQFDNTIACMPQDPNTLKKACTKWYRAQDGVNYCSTGNRWERRWVRGCTERLLTEEFCSDSIDPNTIEHDRLEPIDERDPTRNPNRRPNRRPCAPGVICG